MRITEVLGLSAEADRAEYNVTAAMDFGSHLATQQCNIKICIGM